MGISVFPVPSSSAGPSANAITCASPNVLYGAQLSLTSGIYTITCANTTVAKVQFLTNTNTILTTATTASGTVTVNIGSAVDRVRVWTDTGTNIVVTIALTAGAMTNNISGTLDVITTSGTYTGTSASGYGYALVCGGGGGGSGTNNTPTTYAGTGGGAGGYAYGIVALTGSMPVTIGAGGTAGSGNGSVGGNGGTTTFGGLTATGGQGGVVPTPSTLNAGQVGGLGGTPNGAQGYGQSSGYNSGAGGLNTSPYSFITNSQYIGTAGGGGNNAGGNGTFGGGGGGQANGPAGTGGAGVVYVLKF